MNKKLEELALQIGGSHYPVVSEQYLETTVRLVIEQCAQAFHKTRPAEVTLKEHLLSQFDLK